MRRNSLCILACAVFLFPMVRAQQKPPDTTAGNPPPHTLHAFAEPADSLVGQVKRSKSPSKAMILSAILPGAGQAYNESWWKVPIVTGLGIYFVSSWLYNNRMVADYRDQYNQSLLENPYGNSQILALRNFYKSQRDSFAWYFVILYVLNIVDAYVDASLYDFDVSETLSLRVLPHGSRWEVRLQF